MTTPTKQNHKPSVDLDKVFAEMERGSDYPRKPRKIRTRPSRQTPSKPDYRQVVGNKAYSVWVHPNGNVLSLYISERQNGRWQVVEKLQLKRM